MSCRAAGASPAHSHLLLLPVPPHLCGTAAPGPPQPPPMGRFRGLTPKPPPQEAVPLGRAQCPCSAASDICTTGKARPPAGQNSHLGESISSHTHFIYCSMQQRITQSQPQVWIHGLEIRQDPSLLNASFTPTGCPQWCRKTKVTKGCCSWGLFFFSHPISRLTLTFFLLPCKGEMNLESSFSNESMKT